MTARIRRWAACGAVAAIAVWLYTGRSETTFLDSIPQYLTGSWVRPVERDGSRVYDGAVQMHVGTHSVTVVDRLDGGREIRRRVLPVNFVSLEGSPDRVSTMIACDTAGPRRCVLVEYLDHGRVSAYDLVPPGNNVQDDVAFPIGVFNPEP